MKDDPRWIDVTALFVDGPAAVAPSLQRTIPASPSTSTGSPALRNILEREFHIEAITGADKTVDVVVDIFNRVNSGGTKLSKGDLALARICAEWGTPARPCGAPGPLARHGGSVHSRLAAAQRQRRRHRSCALLRPRGRLRRGFPGRAQRDRAPRRPLPDRSSRPARPGPRPRPDGPLRDPGDPRQLHNHGAASPTAPRRTRPSTGTSMPRSAAASQARRRRYLAKDLETVDKRGIDGVITASPHPQGQPGDRRPGLRGRRPRLPLLPAALPARPRRGARDLVTGHPLGNDASAVQVYEIFPQRCWRRPATPAPRSTRSPTSPSSPRRRPWRFNGDPTQLPGGRGSRRSGLAVDPGRRLADGELPASSSPPDGSCWPPRRTRSSTACSCAACRDGWRRSRSSPTDELGVRRASRRSTRWSRS